MKLLVTLVYARERQDRVIKLKKVQKIQKRKVNPQPQKPVKKAPTFKAKPQKVEPAVIDTTPGVGVWIPSKEKSGVFRGQ